MPVEEVDRSTESIVADAIKSADLPADPNEVVPDADTVETAEVAEEEPEVKVVAKEGEKPAEAVVAGDEDDDPELTKLLESYGIKRGGKEQRDNRMPYSRVRKIIGKAVKAVHDKNQTLIGEETTKLTAAQQRLSNFEAADALAKSDPRRYLALLSAINPEFQQFLTPAQAKEEVKKVEAAAAEPIPGPDLKFADGSVGYTPEQQDKRDAWIGNKAKADALVEMRKEMEPLLKAHQTGEVNAQLAPRIRSQVDRATKLWGEEFLVEYRKGENSDIIKLLKSDPSMSFDAACATVLMPRRDKATQVDREKMRTELLTELDKRPAAARRTLPAQSKPEPTTTDRSTEDIVREAVAAAGLR